jgi:hypothetical protein
MRKLYNRRALAGVKEIYNMDYLAAVKKTCALKFMTMKYYGWKRIAIIILVLVANTAFALFTAFCTAMTPLFFNIDLFEPGDWSPTIEEKLYALCGVSIIGSLFLLVAVGLATWCNRRVCKSFAANEQALKSCVLYLGLLSACGALLGEAICVEQVLLEA